MDLAALQAKVNNYTTVVGSWVKDVGNLYFSSTPQNVTVKLLDENGNVTTNTIPNAAKFRKTVWDDIGTALGQLSKSFYVDSVNGDDTNSGISTEPLKTIKKAIDLTPVGGVVYIYIKEATENLISEHIKVENKMVYLNMTIGTQKATIKNEAYENGTYSYAYGFELKGHSCIYSRGVIFEHCDVKNNIAFAPNGHGLFHTQDSSVSAVSLYDCEIKVDKDNSSFLNLTRSSKVNAGMSSLGLYNTTVTTLSKGYLIDATNSICGYQETSSPIDDLNHFVKGMIRDVDSGNPINVISNRNLSL